MSKREMIVAVFTVALLLMIGGHYYSNYKECKFNNGDYVRGAFGMVCVNEAKGVVK